MVVVVLLFLGSAYTFGYQVYQSHNTMSASFAGSPSPGWSTLYFKSASGVLLAEFNYSTARLLTANSTGNAAAFGFKVWHATGFSVQGLNLTFSIGPYPAKVWMSQFSYYTGNYPTLDTKNVNYTGGPSEVSGAVLTLSGFPASGDPSTIYSVGLSYGNTATPETVGSTSVMVQMVLVSGSGVPYVGELYSGASGFNLVAG